MEHPKRRQWHIYIQMLVKTSFIKDKRHFSMKFEMSAFINYNSAKCLEAIYQRMKRFIQGCRKIEIYIFFDVLELIGFQWLNFETSWPTLASTFSDNFNSSLVHHETEKHYFIHGYHSENDQKQYNNIFAFITHFEDK